MTETLDGVCMVSWDRFFLPTENDLKKDKVGNKVLNSFLTKVIGMFNWDF